MIETVYLIKHVERHDRQEPENPWSFRQMGVYHKADNKNGDTFLILNPSKSYRRRLKHVSKSSVLGPWEIHMMLLKSAMQNWRWCITSLEKDYETMVRSLACCAETTLKIRRRLELICLTLLVLILTFATTTSKTFKYFKINVSSYVIFSQPIVQFCRIYDCPDHNKP